MLRKINWKYALGEVLIVIIGITIAFGLNTWGEEQKNQENRMQYLENLKIDIDQEISHLEQNIADFEKKSQLALAVMPFVDGKKEGLDTMGAKVFGLTNVTYFYPGDITYSTLINTGDLSLFRDFEFKKKIEAHYSDHQLIEMDYKRQNNIQEKYLGDFMMYEVDMGAFRSRDFSFISNPRFANIVRSLYGTYQICIQTSKEGIERCNALKTVLEKKIIKKG